jgi:hypothetical protein
MGHGVKTHTAMLVDVKLYHIFPFWHYIGTRLDTKHEPDTYY